MSKVITFSRQFPSYHPRAGEPTYFVEKIWDSFEEMDFKYTDGLTDEYLNFCRRGNDLIWPKYHTIRAGHRFKVGDWFSPRVWSGKPYRSKQIIIAPDIQVKQVWDVEADEDGCLWIISDHDDDSEHILDKVAKNDGLTRDDLMDWFNKPFIGQIICWNEKIEY